MADAPIRIGILGAARIAPGALIEPARQRDDVRVVSVAARDPERARAFADQHGLDDAAPDYAALIARDDLDLIYVALPPHLHRRWTVAALEAGKAVLCEKPFAMDAGEAQTMVDAARRTSSILIDAFHYRFHRMMVDAVALMRAGAIGEPVSASATANYPIPLREGEPRWSAASGGGALMDLGCYGIHALRALLDGEPAVIAATRRVVHGVDAATDARLLFPDGVEAELHTAMDPPAPATALGIVGTRGRIDIEGFIQPQRAGRSRLTVDGVERRLPTDGPSSYAAQLAHVVAVLRGGATPLTGGDDAVANMRVVDAIAALAAVTPGAPVSPP